MRIITSQTALVYLAGAVLACIVAAEIAPPVLEAFDSVAATYSAINAR